MNIKRQKDAEKEQFKGSSKKGNAALGGSRAMKRMMRR
tara:strand:- start:17 stop:130 length:114 start_codon:yes stop_codon:yes gene_type:complete